MIKRNHKEIEKLELFYFSIDTYLKKNSLCFGNVCFKNEVSMLMII